MISIFLGRKLLPLTMKTYAVLSAMIMLMIGFTSAEKIDTHIPCGNTTECRSMTLPEDAFCKDGYCMCPNIDNGIDFCSSISAFMHENKTPGPLYYRTCKQNNDCKYMGGFCNSTINQCDCTKDYVPSSNRQKCVQKVRNINADCTDKNQCLGFLANTTCENNTCVCISGYHYVEPACWRMAGYRQPCKQNQECSYIDGMICMDMKCECASGTVLNMDSKRCLVAATKIQDECIESVQCSATFENSSCLNKTCQCESGYHYEHNLTRCFLNRALDEECANNYECYQTEDYEKDLQSPIKSVMCKANTCTCVENYVRQENKCVSAASLFGTSIIISVITLLCSTLL